MPFFRFFSRHTQGKCSLGGLEGHSEALQSKTPGRLNHKNEFVTQGYKKIQEFREQVLKQLADNNPRELLDYLVAKLPTGAPNYSMLSLETQNYISYNRNWPNIEKELMKPGNFQVNQQQELLKLLSRNNVNHENLSAITWSKYSSKPLIEIELKKIAGGLTDTVAAYKEKRARQWYKGIENMSRKQQCAELLTVAKKINTLLKSKPVSKELIYEKLVESIKVLDRIDKEISSEEQNWFQSSLQKQINIFRNKLKEMCQLENYDFKSNNFDETITLEMAAQLNKINDPSIRAIMMKLPAHCHTDEAIHLFNKLSYEEFAKVASYLRIEYREITNSLDKATLLEREIPQLFREVNMQQLSRLKDDVSINQQVYEKLSLLADKIPPELCTKENIQLWSADIQKLDESHLSELLAAAGNDPNKSELIDNFRVKIQGIRDQGVDPEVTAIRVR